MDNLTLDKLIPQLRNKEWQRDPRGKTQFGKHRFNFYLQYQTRKGNLLVGLSSRFPDSDSHRDYYLKVFLNNKMVGLYRGDKVKGFYSEIETITGEKIPKEQDTFDTVMSILEESYA